MHDCKYYMLDQSIYIQEQEVFMHDWKIYVLQQKIYIHK